MDLNLAILLLVSMILLVNWEYLLFQLSVLYLNYDTLENGKIHHVLFNHLTNNIPTMSHYSWTKESRTLDKKLNGKKTKWNKQSFIGKEMSSNPQKLKKKNQLFTRRMILDLFQKSETLTFQYPKYQLGILLDFSN